jgi:PAT family beta-lactamase induction signal transducer AmpG
LLQGIPNAIVQTTSGLIYTTMGISVAALAFWTSVIYLPWAIKPLWSAYVEVISTKRNWIIVTQLLLGALFIAAGSVMPLKFFFPLSISIFAIIAFTSASHDIAADGFYMHALDQHNQTFFVGIRSTFYRIAMLTATGFIPLLAGLVQEKTGLEPVMIKVNAVQVSQYQPIDAPVVSDSVAKGKPQIVLHPADITIPLVQPGISESDTAVTWVTLSAPPEEGKNIVLNLTFKSGSKDIKLSNRSGRFEFNSQNWNKPVKVLFNVNHNLDKNATASFKVTAGNVAFSWTASLMMLGIFLILLAVYHKFILPRPVEIKSANSVDLKVYGEVFISFFKKPGIVPALLFFLLYRFGEAQSIKIVTPFLVASRASGGIGLTQVQFGIAYGTIGMIALTLGGILGGLYASKYGLKKLIWIMALSMNLPNLGLLFIATTQPMPGDWSVYGAIVLEQFGYGFGFTAYMLYMLYFVGDSKYKAAEYAFGTSLMAIGVILPGMLSGYMQEWLGYHRFFVYIMFCTIPGMLLIPFLKINSDFGIKKSKP